MRRTPPMRQAYLPGFESLKERSFGGSFIKGHARAERPISTRRSMHLVLRSSLAVGERSFLSRGLGVERLVRRVGRMHGVRVYRFANRGNHLHLIVRPRSRQAFHGFLRTITGLIARIFFAAERGFPAG